MKNYLFSGIINKEARQLLKKDLASANKLVAIAGCDDTNINDQYFYYGNDEYEAITTTFKSISKISEFCLLDNRISRDQARLDVVSADVIYLTGGIPYQQWQYIKRNCLDELLVNKDLLIGLSAGSMNQSKISYDCRSDDITTTFTFKALNLVNFMINPHWLDTEIPERDIELNKVLASTSLAMICLPEESFVLVENNDIKYYGDYKILKKD